MKADEVVYLAMIRQVMPYFTGATDTPPIPSAGLIEPELAAMAARISWLNHGQKVFLTDLREDDPGFDGTQFAREYRRTRLAAAKKINQFQLQSELTGRRDVSRFFHAVPHCGCGIENLGSRCILHDIDEFLQAMNGWMHR